jgi:hypothetical protein
MAATCSMAAKKGAAVVGFEWERVLLVGAYAVGFEEVDCDVEKLLLVSA